MGHFCTSNINAKVLDCSHIDLYRVLRCSHFSILLIQFVYSIKQLDIVKVVKVVVTSVTRELMGGL